MVVWVVQFNFEKFHLYQRLLLRLFICLHLSLLLVVDLIKVSKALSEIRCINLIIIRISEAPLLSTIVAINIFVILFMMLELALIIILIRLLICPIISPRLV